MFSLSPRLLQPLNIAAYVLVIVVNALSNAVPLNGRTAGEISDALPSYFTPAGYTFSIWGLIYLGLLAYTIFQALPAQRDAAFVQQIGPLFALSCVANSAWIFAWHYGYYGLSIVLMLSLLVTLIAIYVRLNIGRPEQSASRNTGFFVHFPFSIYLGWITVATIANFASVLPFYGWDGFGIDGPVWSATMMLVAVVVAAGVLLNRRNLPYAGVLIWALFGIRSAQAGVPLVANVALLAAVLIAALAVVGYRRVPAPGA